MTELPFATAECQPIHRFAICMEFCSPRRDTSTTTSELYGSYGPRRPRESEASEVKLWLIVFSP